ncbi:MAG: hypothetical protein JSU63_20665 [Phycisphaerales bacterium]|nr:MAG: hypothetical protein JSU63_20665 [Phycisphaerales bacterium]
MYKLTATFQIELASWIRLYRAESDALQYRAAIDGFDVEIVLIPDDGLRMSCPGDTFDTRAITQVKVSVSRDEDSCPPGILISAQGGRDFRKRAPWFGQRQEEYRIAAVKAVNRLARFCKYVLWIPNVREFLVHDSQFQNPQWIGEDYAELTSGMDEALAMVISARGPRLLGQKDFTADEDALLQHALQDDVVVETYQEFLADAQTSIVNGNIPRAILEMAIACEIAVKQALFKKTVTAPGASKGSRQNRRERWPVSKLIDVATKETLGESFRQVEKDAYQHIVLLFRTRNEVAHRGRPVYPDDADDEHPVGRAVLEEWWPSVELLMRWIGRHRD